MSNDLKIIIIHGTGGNPNGNWFPWLNQELTALGYETVVPTFPTPEGQSLQTWKDAFANQVGAVKSNMILVGHSVGAGFILNLLEDAEQPIMATYLVSGWLGKLGLPDFDPLIESFVCRPFNWEKIRRNVGHACVINSDNDPYVPLYKGEELAEKLIVPVTLIPGAKHINEESGYTSFPLLLEMLQSQLSEQAAGRLSTN